MFLRSIENQHFDIPAGKTFMQWNLSLWLREATPPQSHCQSKLLWLVLSEASRWSYNQLSVSHWTYYWSGKRGFGVGKLWGQKKKKRRLGWNVHDTKLWFRKLCTYTLVSLFKPIFVCPSIHCMRVKAESTPPIHSHTYSRSNFRVSNRFKPCSLTRISTNLLPPSHHAAPYFHVKQCWMIFNM